MLHPALQSGLDGEDEVRRNLDTPVLERNFARQPVEAVVEFHRIEVSYEILQPVRGFEVFRIELIIPPMLVVSAAGADECMNHGPIGTEGASESGSESYKGESRMNKDILKGKWLQVKGDVRSWWGKITDDDVNQIQGDTEKFIGKLQERYGYGREQAEKEINDFLTRPNDQRRRTA